MINCDKFLNCIDDYLENNLPDDIMTQMNEHIKTCTSCMEELEFATNLKSMLSQLPKIPVPNDFKQDVLKKFDALEKEKTKAKRFDFSKLYKSWQPYSALAACVLLVVLVKTGVWEETNQYLPNATPSIGNLSTQEQTDNSGIDSQKENTEFQNAETNNIQTSENGISSNDVVAPKTSENPKTTYAQPTPNTTPKSVRGRTTAPTTTPIPKANNVVTTTQPAHTEDRTNKGVKSETEWSAPIVNMKGALSTTEPNIEPNALSASVDLQSQETTTSAPSYTSDIHGNPSGEKTNNNQNGSSDDGGFDDVSSGNVGSDDIGSDNVGSGNGGSDDIGSGNVGSGNVGSDDVGSGNVGSDDVGSGNVGSDDIGSDNVGSDDVGSGGGVMMVSKGSVKFSIADKDAVMNILKNFNITGTSPYYSSEKDEFKKFLKALDKQNIKYNVSDNLDDTSNFMIIFE